jgi:hypothetical protein
MNARLSKGIVLLLRAEAGMRVANPVGDSTQASGTLTPSAVPGISYSTREENRGIYVEDSLLNPRCERGGIPVRLSHAITIRGGELVLDAAVHFEHRGSQGQHTITLSDGRVVDCYLQPDGYLRFDEQTTMRGLLRLYSQILRSDVRADATLFESGGTSQDMQLLLLSINAIYATDIAARQFFASSSVAEVSKLLGASSRRFRTSPLLEMIGEFNG